MELTTLTPELQKALGQLPAKRLAAVTELRFRIGAPVKLAYPRGEELLTLSGQAIPVTEKLLKELLDRATGFSPYALKLEESGLYLPLEGGCRMGLCGEAVMRDGKLQGIRHISSAVIRLARQHMGVASGAARQLTEEGCVQSALIVSPPGQGKTTFLRDLARQISEMGYRVSVVDERRELAAAKNGVPQLDVGPSTDVLTGCTKSEAIPLLVRVMNPQVLVLDELMGEAELRAAGEASFCGIALLATAHGDGLASLMARPGYRTLLESGAFRWCITLKNFDAVKIERLGTYAEDCGSLLCRRGVAHGRMGGASDHGAAAPPAETNPTGAGADAGRNGAQNAHCGRAV